MLIKTDDDWADENAEPLFPNVVIADWKNFNEEVLEDIAQALDAEGIDVIDHETGGDFWAFRFVKKELA